MLRLILEDVRYALRRSRKAPGISVTVVAALALFIGAKIAVFTILNCVLLRPLRYAHPDRLVAHGFFSFFDCLTFSAVILVLAAAAFAATWLPARRPAAVDPIFCFEIGVNKQHD